VSEELLSSLSVLLEQEFGGLGLNFGVVWRF
jgi:hypothetical protein